MPCQLHVADHQGQQSAGNGVFTDITPDANHWSGLRPLLWSWPQGQAVDRTLTRTGDLMATGVTTDADVRPGARIMVLSVLLYGFVQVSGARLST